MRFLPNPDTKPIRETKISQTRLYGLWEKFSSWIGRFGHRVWIVGLSAFLVLLIIFLPDYVWQIFWSGIKAQLFLVGLIIVFCLVTVSLVWKLGQRIDVLVFLFFNMHGKRPVWLDKVMLGFTQIGNFAFALILATVIDSTGNHLLAYALIIGVLSLTLFVHIIKILVRRRRPYIRLENIRIVGSAESGRSFPSGHTSQAFFLATLLLQYNHLAGYLWVILYTVASLVGITRIYVGMHYPRDVLGGAILGTSWGIVGVLLSTDFVEPFAKFLFNS